MDMLGGDKIISQLIIPECKTKNRNPGCKNIKVPTLYFWR